MMRYIVCCFAEERPDELQQQVADFLNGQPSATVETIQYATNPGSLLPYTAFIVIRSQNTR